MSLGEAFIEVRADTRPFVRDLDRQVRTAIQRIEGLIQRSLPESMARAGEQGGEQAGQRAGRSFTRRMRQSVENEGSNVFVSLASALGSALDDGISALPTEVKAALVAGILLATPQLAAMLGALVTTSLGVAVAGIGTLLAFQFEDVQQRAVEFGRNVRNVLTESAEAFGPAVLNAFDLVENRIEAIAPTLERIFDSASGFVAPLTAGLLEGIQAFVDALDRITPRLQPFIDTFATGLQSVLETVALGLERLSESGENGRQALEDFFTVINVLIMAFIGVIGILTEVNNLFHELFELVIAFNPIIGVLVSWLGDKLPGANGALAVTNTDAANSFNGLIAATKGEERAARDLTKSLDILVAATFRNIQVDIDYERSLDRISESLKENGKTLDIHSEKGRQNVEAFMSGLKAAEQRALQRVQTQGYTTQQASALYDQEIAQLRAVARQAGITDEQFNSLFGEILAVSSLRISSEEIGVDGLAASLSDAERQAASLLSLIRHLGRSIIGGAFAGTGLGGFADGDIVDRPTVGVFGEAGPEVVIPLTKPARAAELAQKSGLTAMIGNDGTIVMVFIGDEQLDAKMVKVVERSNRSQALALSHGGRS